jgi:hypothetical protein
MSSSTTNLDTISSSQEDKEGTANEMFDALSPPSLYGRRASTTTGVTWGFYGGGVMISGSLSSIVNSTVALTASAVNYLEVTPSTGLLTKVTSAFTPGKIPIYTVNVGASSILTYTDHRIMRPPEFGRKAIALSDANYTLTAIEARNNIIEFTGTLTTSRQVVFPNEVKQYSVFNNTNHQLDMKTAAGSGAVIDSAKKAIILSDGTHIQRWTADL